jgi:peroxiredoxin
MDVMAVEVGLAVLSIAGCWLGYQLVAQNGRLLLRVEALEEQLVHANTPGAMPPGLPAGSVLHDFELKTLSGDRMTLSQWRGYRLLLVFVDPRCSPCRALLPEIAALPLDGSDGRPVPILVSTGDPDENRRWMDECGVRGPVLLQDEAELAHLYLVTGTPMGYLVDAQGVTVGTAAVGAPQVLALAAPNPGCTAEPDHGGVHNRQVGSPPTLPLSTSRILRDGLKRGTVAPDFRLPRLGDGELSLSAYRGKQVLLVFSDPACGPCDRLAPHLEQLHRRQRELNVVMVSRGDPQATIAKASEHGLTFPIVLQRHWEISRAYGMFATPIAFLIDEHGVIAADVAEGADAILGLARRQSRGTRRVVAPV